MKNTTILSALALSFALATISGNAAMAQEYITTQSAELNQAIARAEKAQSDANASGTVRGQQISNYIGEMLDTAKNQNYANSAELTRALNDAAVATPLLLGTNRTDNNKNTAGTSTARTVASTQSEIATVAETAPATTSAAKTETVVAAAPQAATTLAAKTTTKPASAEISTAKTTGTTIKIEVKAEPEAAAEVKPAVVTAIADPAAEKVVLANATVNNTVSEINANPETTEIPNTSEAQNTIGRIIATAVAAVIAMFGAILIVKRMKKNA